MSTRMQIALLSHLVAMVAGLRPMRAPTRCGPYSRCMSRPAPSIVQAVVQDDVLEAGVVSSIRNVLSAGSQFKPKRLFSALLEFGNSTGGLVQTWLTPQRLEEACFFWYEGSSVLARDLRCGRFSFNDMKASGWFSVLALGTFPWTPLLVPLVRRALNATDEGAFVPRALGTRRIKALKRLRKDNGLAQVIPKFSTPQNIEEGVRFFSDGGRLLVRDSARGRLLARKDDTLSVYALFASLSFSTFPLTPLLLPLIDKRRPDGQQSDYVPSSFRAERLAAFQQLRAGTWQKLDPQEIVRAAGAETKDRPPPGVLLSAIVALKPTAGDRARFLEALAGGGTPGRRWRLVYVVGKGAVISARRENKYHSGRLTQSPLIEDVTKALLPWTRLKEGLYVDGLVTAIQRFDLESLENENGIFGFLENEWLRFTVVGPFKWPEPSRRSVCGFEPNRVRCKIGSLEKEWRISAETAESFEAKRINELPFFRFLHVDDSVAVAQGRSGSIAVWSRLRCDDS